MTAPTVRGQTTPPTAAGASAAPAPAPPAPRVLQRAVQAMIDELQATDPSPVVTVTGLDGGKRVVQPPSAVDDAPPALRYTPITMVEFLIANPGLELRAIAKAFGRTMGWLSTVVASDQFQRTLDPRRSEVLDPYFTSTMDERFRSLALRSSHILLEKLDGREVSDQLVLKATELSIKALGMGIAPPETPAVVERKLSVAEKMEAAMMEMDRRSAERTLEAVLVEVPEGKNE